MSTLLRLAFGLIATILLATACSAGVTEITEVGSAPVAESQQAEADSQGVDDSSADVADAAGSFEASPEFLERAKQQVDAAPSMRFESYIEMDTGIFNIGDRDTPFMVGESSGTRASVNVDMGGLLGPLVQMGGIDSNNLTMSLITEGDDVYLQAPFFAEILSMDGSGSLPGFEWVDSIATGWGQVDASVFGDEDALSTMGAGADASQTLALLESATDVTDGGSGEVRGVPTRIATATVTLNELFAAAGQDPSELGISPAEQAELGDTSADIDVHVDDQGFVRRMEFTMDLSALASSDSELGDVDVDMVMWQRIDFYDFGADVTIDIPTDAIDITDDFGLLMELGG